MRTTHRALLVRTPVSARAVDPEALLPGGPEPEARVNPWRLLLSAAAAGLIFLAPWPMEAGNGSGTLHARLSGAESMTADLYGTFSGAPDPPGGAPMEMRAAVVALRPTDRPVPAVDRGTPVMDRNGIRFVPHVLPVERGTPVKFVNSDPVFHNVFPLSPAGMFDPKRSSRGNARTVVFDHAGVVRVSCNVDSSIPAYVVVLDTPYFTLTGADGSYRFTGLPAGRYEVTAWAEGLTRMVSLGAVKVPASGSVEFTASPGGR